ncbi:hypothetical protein ACWGCP_04025, partial [Streptomyces niveus]
MGGLGGRFERYEKVPVPGGGGPEPGGGVEVGVGVRVIGKLKAVELRGRPGSVVRPPGLLLANGGCVPPFRAIDAGRVRPGAGTCGRLVSRHDVRGISTAGGVRRATGAVVGLRRVRGTRSVPVRPGAGTCGRLVSRHDVPAISTAGGVRRATGAVVGLR